ncbi:MAG: hypothetical protein AAF193_10495, partial [Bacteroidota bacterium]
FTCDDGSCSYTTGCAQPLADNYDPSVPVECGDDSCIYSNAPENDDCANAMEVFEGGTLFTNINATADPSYSIPSGGVSGGGWSADDTEVQAGVFFRYTTPSFDFTSIRIQSVNASNLAGASLIGDTQIAVFDACDGTLLAANENGGLQQHGSVTLECSNLQPNTEYIILVDARLNNGEVPRGYATLLVNPNVGADACRWGCTDDQACNFDPDATQDDGSCEYISCVFCTGDLNGDNVINAADLLVFLSDFGCDGMVDGNCVGDFNGDNETNAADLLTFLSVFGSECP